MTSKVYSEVQRIVDVYKSLEDQSKVNALGDRISYYRNINTTSTRQLKRSTPTKSSKEKKKLDIKELPYLVL
jgi:hypothetical protein